MKKVFFICSCVLICNSICSQNLTLQDPAGINLTDTVPFVRTINGDFQKNKVVKTKKTTENKNRLSDKEAILFIEEKSTKLNDH